MDNLDLNIDNYSLEDLLDLFKITWDYGENELKTCKKMVFMTHPDKSKLDKKFFLFFKKAYSILYKIYETKTRKNQNRDDIMTKEDEKYILRFKKNKNFNKIFNELFEKYKLKDDDGYGDWLTSNEDCSTERVNNVRDMNELIETKKQNIRALVKQSDYTEANAGYEFSLDNEKPEYYSCGIFSKLGYEDLKRAHVESVIPVTKEDYDNVPKFTSEFELEKHRSNQGINIPTIQESKNMLQENDDKLNKEHMYRLYKLTRESEEVEQRNKQILGRFRQLTN